MRHRLFVLLMAVSIFIGLVPADALAAAWAPSLPVRQQERVYLSLFDDGTGYSLQVQGGDALFLKTEDGGVTWTLMPETPGVGSPRIDFASPKVGYLAASGDLFRTTDGGETWSDLKPPTRDFVAWKAISVDRGGRALALIGELWRNGKGSPWRPSDCHDPRRDQIVSYVSSNGGKSWKKGLVFDGPSGAFDADFFGWRHGVLTLDSRLAYEENGDCGFQGSGEVGKTIMATHNGGRTWQKVTDCPKPAGCMATEITSPKHFLTATTDGRVLVTFDGGRTFKSSTLDGFAELPTREHVRWAQGIAFGNHKVGYVSTNGRGIWRTTDGGVTWEREVSPQDAPGYSFGTVAAAGPAMAISGGPNFLIRRIP